MLRCHDRHHDVDSDFGTGGIVDATGKSFLDDIGFADLLLNGLQQFPLHGGNVVRNPSQHFAFKVFDDLRTVADSTIAPAW